MRPPGPGVSPTTFRAAIPVRCGTVKEASIIELGTVDGVTVGRVTCPHIGEREGAIIVAEAVPPAKGTSGRLALDLSGVQMISSSGLGALITLAKETRTAGGSLVTFGLNKDLMNLIKLTRLDKLFATKPDLHAAIKALK
jgi:anti-anti-sigma factor